MNKTQTICFHAWLSGVCAREATITVIELEGVVRICWDTKWDTPFGGTSPEPVLRWALATLSPGPLQGGRGPWGLEG